MKIKRIFIDGFRCLCDFELEFENNLTLIVGENDCGKSSLIDCLNLFTGDYDLEVDDFNDNKGVIRISLETDDLTFEKTFDKENYREPNLIIKPTGKYLDEIKHFIDSLTDTIDSEQDSKLKEIAKLFGLTVRVNSNPETLKSGIDEKISEEQPQIENGKFPELNKIQLDGKQFEDVEGFFKEVFIKDKQNEIWNIKIKDDKSIREIIQEQLDNYSNEISQSLKEGGIKDKIKEYLKNLTDIKVEPSFEPKSLNISSKVKFLEEGNEISVVKKGDGTKRRISLALLEYKSDIEGSCLDSRLYVLDEPDTHLHVKAQLELLGVLKELSEKGCQIILTTHSPFLINAIKPKQIRLLYQADSNTTELRSLRKEPETSDKILRQLGIENVYLYFAKRILLVEGETELYFIPRIYERLNSISLNSDLIKIINTKGIKNIPGFSKALLELVDPDTIYVLKDNDASSETIELIEKLNIPNDRQFTIGNKEFEDAFPSQVLFNAWKQHLEACGKDLSRSQWTEENIERLKSECQSSDGKKFSKELTKLNAGTNKRITKILLGEVLGNHCVKEDLPDCLRDLLKKLKD